MTATDSISTSGRVVAFWESAGRERWFAKDDGFDATCRDLLLPSYEAAEAGFLHDWELTAAGSLALVILLDQIPRNVFRGRPVAYATDERALAVAVRSLELGLDRQVAAELREVFYLPFTHSERLETQDRSVALYERLGHPDALRFARHHREIVARFGRFPHRNAVLGRTSTPEELAFLGQDHFRG